MTTSPMNQLTINWNRAIFVDEPLTDNLVKRLAPQILKLRQESKDPITVAIDSPGGSLASLDTLIGLLTGPMQDKSRGNIVTVSTNRAYSAAANLLAFGDYSVALRHSQILCHDVRFGEVEDVTSSKAMDIAKSLQAENDRFALKLANRIVWRLIWSFIDLRPKFPEIQSKWPKRLAKYKSALGQHAIPNKDRHFVNIACFATSLYANLSRENRGLIDNVMNRLGKWVALTDLSNSYPTYRVKGSRTPGLLDGARNLHKVFEYDKDNLTNSEDDLKLFLTLLVSRLDGLDNNFAESIEEANRNFLLIQSMNEEKHRDAAMTLVLRHQLIFFGKNINNLKSDERDQLVEKAIPYAQLFWLFCVSLCRELFEGEHILKPTDGQLLGLVDEVSGGGVIESRREWEVKKLEKQKTTSPAQKNNSKTASKKTTQSTSNNQK